MLGIIATAIVTSITRALMATVASSPPTSPSFTAWRSETGPTWMRDGFESLAAMSFERRPSRREITSPRIEASVSTPTPPMLTPMKTSVLPNGDQCVAMSTVARPVTQMTDTAVNTASCSGVTCRSALAMGRENSTVNTRMSPAKMRIAKRAGELRTSASTASRTPPSHDRRP